MAEDTYAATVRLWAAAGWQGIIPVPARCKTPPEEGYTGRNGADPTPAQLAQWCQTKAGYNAALRFPRGVIGLDIDAYKAEGMVSYQSLVDLCGPLPATYCITSRDDGVSGCYLYRVAEALELKSAWPGIDILQRHHRYAILPGSIHPDGRVYRLTGFNGGVPRPLELTELTGPWLEHLGHQPKNDLQTLLSGSNLHGITSFSSLVKHFVGRIVSGESTNRNDVGLELAIQLRDNRCPFVDAETVFMAGYQKAVADVGDHPYTIDEALATLRSVWSQPTRDRLATFDIEGFEAGNEAAYAAEVTQELRKLHIRARAKELFTAQPVTDEALEIFIDWESFWAKERSEAEWLYEPILSKGRAHVIYAPHKAGKSLLLLWLAAKLAETCVVIYLDFEMTEDDLYGRLADMGYEAEAQLVNLRYALLPSLPPLDSPQGALVLLALIDREREAQPDKAIVLFIDTTSRAVAGEENSADTIQNFYRYTGLGLKQRGVTWARADHAGKDPTKGQRGSSAKGDDVDIVWEFAASDDGIVLHRNATRLAAVPEKVALQKLYDPLAFKVVAEGWPPRTQEIALVLDSLHVDISSTVRVAGKALRDGGFSATQKVVGAALKWRREHLADGLISAQAPKKEPKNDP